MMDRVMAKQRSESSESAQVQTNEIVDLAIAAKVEIGKIGNEPLFDLCQRLRGIISNETPASDLNKPVKDFYGKHTELKDQYSLEEVLLMFEDIWDGKKVKWAKMPYLPIAVERARKKKEPRPEMVGCGDKKLCFLAQVCFELQELAPKNEPFSISQYQVAVFLDICPRMGRLLLDKLERKGVLKLHKKGNFKKKLANTYFYVTSTVSCFKSNGDYLQDSQELQEPIDLQDLHDLPEPNEL